MNQSYLCKPQRKKGEMQCICIILLILAVAVFYLSDLFGIFRAAGQLSAVILLLLFVQITTKFLLTEYEYVLEGSTLYLSSRQGKKVKNLGGIPITVNSVLRSCKTKKNETLERSVKKRFSYCQNLFPAGSYELLCHDGEGYVSLTFEPDETLVALIQNQIEEKKKKEGQAEE